MFIIKEKENEEPRFSWGHVIYWDFFWNVINKFYLENLRGTILDMPLFKNNIKFIYFFTWLVFK